MNTPDLYEMRLRHMRYWLGEAALAEREACAEPWSRPTLLRADLMDRAKLFGETAAGRLASALAVVES